MKDNLNPDLAIEGVLLTMADFRTNLTKEVIQEAREYFKAKVFETVIPRSIRLTEAPSYGKPVALYDKDSIGALKYAELGEEFLARNQPVHNEQEVEHKREGEAGWSEIQETVLSWTRSR